MPSAETRLSRLAHSVASRMRHLHTGCLPGPVAIRTQQSSLTCTVASRTGQAAREAGGGRSQSVWAPNSAAQNVK